MENITSFEELANLVAENSNLTTTQSAGVVGGLFGMLAGMIAVVIVVALVIYVLLVIAQWKIFTKAGEKGWKSIIPVYNAYILFRIIGLSFWKWLVLSVVTYVLYYIGVNGAIGWLITIGGLAYFVVTLVYAILIARNTAKAFGKGTGFAVGLFFLPNIFQLILGFGSAEYQGVPEKSE